MNTLSIPVGIMASISFYVGFYHLLIYGRRRQHREDLTFALLCLATVLYDVFCIGLYNAASVAEGVRWQRAQFIALAFFGTAFLWFASDYTRQKPTLVTYAFSTFYLLALIVQIVDRSNLTWVVASPSEKDIVLPFGLAITYHEATFGPFTTVQSLIGIVVSTYILLNSIRFYRRGYRRQAGPLLLAIGFMFAAVFNDTAVGNGWYKFVYMIEYGYMAMILLMAYSLSNTVVEAAMAKESLRKSEERFRALVETTSDWVWEMDRNGAYIYASPKVHELLGYEPEEIIGKTPFDLMPPDEARRVGAVFQEIMAHQRVFAGLENTARHKDGRLVVLETSGVPVFDIDERFVGYRGIDRDITERKRAEEALRESEQRFRTLAEASFEGIGLSEQGIIVDLNDQLAQMLGYARDELTGTQVMEFVAPESRDLVTEAIGSGRLKPYEHLALRKDGTVFPVEVRARIARIAGRQLRVSAIRDITERKRVEEALRESEQRFQLFMLHFPGLAYIKDAATRVLFANQGFMDYLNLAPSEILGKTNCDIFPAEFAGHITADDQRVLESGASSVIEERYGGRIWSTYKFVISPADKPPLLGGFTLDITERKQAEEALRESQLLLRAVIDAVPLWIAYLDMDGKYVIANQRYVETFGKPLREIESAHYSQVLPPDMVARHKPWVDECLTGKTVPFSDVLRPDSSDAAYVYGVYTPLYGSNGQMQGVTVFVVDITERNRAEEALKRYAAQAQQRAEQLATMNEISHAVSTLQDLDSVLEIIYHQVRRIVLADAFYVGLYDSEHEQVTFPLMYDAGSRYNEPALPLAQAPWIVQVIQTGKPFMLHRTVEDLQTPLAGGLGSPQRKSASVLIVPLWRRESVIGVLSAQSYTMNAYTDEHAKILTGIGHQAAIAIGNAQLYEQAQQEIAERKRAQAEREQLITELEAKNAELERFAYTVSHDLKAPLITIRGFLGFVERDALAGNVERVRADMKRITRATDMMQQLLNELLELSRIGRMMNPPEAVSFETIVREALELVRGSIQERGVQVKLADDLPLVYGDHARLVEVVQNLVDNACKFMGDQPKPRIEIGQRGTDADGKPTLFVRDNGLGIEPQYHAQVFGLFNKLDSHSEGTGVGLALVKRIVEVHGGKIWVESEGAGQGATFYFTLSCQPGAVRL